MKMANKFLSSALSLGLILSPIASVGAKDASKETVSPQRAKVGTGTTAGATDNDDSCRERRARGEEDDDCLKAGYIITGIAAAALLAIVLEIAFDGKKDRGVTPPVPPVPPDTTPPDTTPPATTTPPSTPPTTPPTTTTTTTTTTSTGN